MRSIRVSLLVYFLGLLIVALGVASVLVYRSAQRTLADKEEATAELIRKKSEDRQHEELKRLDDRLLEQTLVLASRLQLELNWGKLTYFPRGEGAIPEFVNNLGILSTSLTPSGYASIPAGLINPAPVPNSVYTLGILSAAMTPSGYVSMASWLVQVQMEQDSEREWRGPGRRGFGPAPPPIVALPIANGIWGSTVVDLKLNQHELVLPHMPRPGDYFQIDIALGPNRWGKPFRSTSLGDGAIPGREELSDGKSLDVDDFELRPGHWVRRARLKAPRIHSVFVAPRPRPRRPDRPPDRTADRGPSRPPPERRPDRPAERAAPPPPSDFIVVQVAADMKKLADLRDELARDRDEQLGALKTETAQALVTLRNRLLTISSVTFLATVLGTWWLVWLGLIPLRRMSDAVSKISPRDFRLQLGDSPLPLELRPIAERLTVTLDQLRRAFAREKQSTADISHELRTPLAAMLTTTELALRKLRTPEQYREFLQDCRGSAQQMNQIVERLLTLARLDAGVDRLRPQSVDVADLAEQCAAVVRPLAEAQGLRLCVSSTGTGGEEPADNSTRLTTDPDKLREVLNNLLHNAIQYNRPSGQIDLTVARDNGHVRVEVRDTGIGIAPEARELIFERFYRADPSRTGDGMNAGLGLAIVKEYVEFMGGRIVVDSAPGQGSTFRVDLPATPAA